MSKSFSARIYSRDADNQNSGRIVDLNQDEIGPVSGVWVDPQMHRPLRSELSKIAV